MSWPNGDKPLQGVGSRWLVRCLPARWLWYGALFVVCLVALAVFFRGCERREILRPTPQMDADAPFWVRVLLLGGAAECTVAVRSPFQVVRSDLGTECQAGQLAMAPTDGTTKITFTDGRFMLGASPLAGSELIISPESPHIFTLNGQNYRGKLKLLVGRSGQTFNAINLVPLEPYLAGVVGCEMPDYWEPQALRAQAIAARTYCLYIKNRFGVNRRWDVNKTQASQVYGGIGAESAQIWEAVNSTCGKVLVAGASSGEQKIEDGEQRTEDEKQKTEGLPSSVRRHPSSGLSGLFPAYYSSICGGHTADSREIFGDRGETQNFASLLTGVPCPYCMDVAKLSLFFWPMARFDREMVTRQLVARYPALGALGPIEELVIAARSDYGQFSRVTSIQLVGATGKTNRLGAEDLRLALDPSGRKIRSMMCQIVPWGNGWAFLAGRGWGHGVGMCQCGAEGMARAGNDAETILQYYYPGCEIVSLY